MKTLDRYILKSFLQPFFATFLIILFVLVMQAMWLAFDNFAGKGISHCTHYFKISLVYDATYGTASITYWCFTFFYYDFRVVYLKTMSLQLQNQQVFHLPRMVRPLIFLTLFLSAINFIVFKQCISICNVKTINI